MYFQKYFGFFLTSTFRDIWRKIPSFMSKIVCWFTFVPFEIILKQGYSLVRLFAFNSAQEDSRSNLPTPLLFFRSYKTSEYSEIHCEQLTSEHFPLYNYRSSTLRGISRNIGQLLRQCRYFVHCFSRSMTYILKESKGKTFWDQTFKWKVTIYWISLFLVKKRRCF